MEILFITSKFMDYLIKTLLIKVEKHKKITFTIG
ncbi:hypothetical protein CLOSAC_06880 [Clostridium saccharobutylicum]|uniref:Uncharacterized protein n=1 Tax=Clostridium saccharobutylicum TaxID=169679 RepID=A0A1S8NIZ8_CLOSA|nr:hypothetical protein CLOSAC_06880 [Clostridium saccharobutylicum]